MLGRGGRMRVEGDGGGRGSESASWGRGEHGERMMEGERISELTCWEGDEAWQRGHGRGGSRQG